MRKWKCRSASEACSGQSKSTIRIRSNRGTQAWENRAYNFVKEEFKCYTSQRKKSNFSAAKLNLSKTGII